VKFLKTTPQSKKREKALANHPMNDKRIKTNNAKICAEKKENCPREK